MIRHTVWWTLAETAEGHTARENALRARKASETLKDIPGLISVEVSCTIAPTTTVPAQLVLHSSHRSMEDLAAYAVHPVHLEFGKLIKAIATSRQALDYEVDE